MRRRDAAAALAIIAVAACAPPPPPLPPPPVVVADTIVVDAVPVAIDTAPPAPPPRLYADIRLAFTGDINLGTNTLPGGVPPDSGRALLRAAAPYLIGDLVVGNFEGALGDTGTSTKCRPNSRLCYVFQTPTHLAPRLVDAGFTHINLANNHANDFGLAGRRHTVRTLSGLGLTVYGPLGRISIDSVFHGDSLTVVGLVGFTTYGYAYNLLDIPRSAAVVDSIAALSDLVIVTFHGGAEGVSAVHTDTAPEFLGNEPRGDLRRWARAVIDAGADAVIGHGPHVLRGIEFYEGKPIAYSLGNFATYRGFSLRGPLGVTAVLQLELSGQGEFIAARLIPMRQRPRQGPRIDPNRAAIKLVRRLSIEDFGPTAARVLETGEVLPPGGLEAVGR